MASIVRPLASGGLMLPAAWRSRRRRRGLRSQARQRCIVSTTTNTSTSDRRQLVSIEEDRVVISTGDDGASVSVEKLRAIGDAAADRVEMHDIIGRQRDNWNHLLIHSTNSLTLAASLMAALAPASASVVALKASAGVLLATTAVAMAAVNKIQPSQIAEEQRNATRLWRELERDLSAKLSASPMATTEADVQAAMERVLALDAAYPLPLLPCMLEKFPKAVEPACWWPRKKPECRDGPYNKPCNGSHGARLAPMAGDNGWSRELEDEMRGIVRVLRARDEQEYLSVGKLALTLNRGLAVAGPALASTAAIATAFIGSGDAGTSWASDVAILGGALAAAVNTVEHGGQVGMVFELCRNVAGFYRKIQDDIEDVLGEADVKRRENGEVFETKLALRLGRSPSDLKQFRKMASPSFRDEDIKDFAGKLF